MKRAGTGKTRSPPLIDPPLRWHTPRSFSGETMTKATQKTPAWQICASAYKSVRGIHQPHIGEISGVQRGRMSKRATVAYDKKRRAEWQASADGSEAWELEVLQAYRADDFSFDDPGLHPDAAAAVRRGLLRAKKAKRDQAWKEYQAMNWLEISEVKKGDRVHSLMCGYGIVTRMSKKSIRIDTEGSDGTPVLVRAGGIQRLHYSDLQIEFEAA